MNETLARLSVPQLEEALRRLREIEAVHTVRMERIEQRLRQALEAHAEIQRLLDLLHEDRARVEAQRQLWTRRWQEWLEEGGAVQHGRVFTQRHAELSGLDQLLREHQVRLDGEAAEALTRVDTVRAERDALERQRRALAERQRQLRRMVGARRDAQADEATAEQTLARWHGLLLEGALP